MLTVLSFGGGQDSTTILYKIILDPEFKSKYVQGHLIVLMSDTGDEHSHTYEHVIYIKTLCLKNGIDFFLLQPEDGFHQRTWPSLRDWMEYKDGIQAKSFPKSCTDNLKIRPIYSFLAHYVNEFFQLNSTPKNKKSLYQYHEKYGQLDVLLGIAAGEEKRVQNKESPSKWMNVCINKVYPLITEGLDRQGCQDYIRETGLSLPYPSNCILCPFMSKIELLWMYRFIPDDFEYWVGREKAKLKKWEGQTENNSTVWGSKPLTEILHEAIDEYGHMTDEELDEYKMSHGHCVMSKY